MRFSSILLTVLALAVGVGTAVVMSSFATKPPVPEKVEPEIAVAVVEARIAAYRPRVSVIGQIEAKDEAVLTSPLETEVIAVQAEEGDLVSKDASLVKLDTRESVFRLEIQQANILQLEASLESVALDLATERRRLQEIRKLEQIARDDLERNRTLLERGVVSQAAYDQAQTALSGRELEILAQRQKIDTLQIERRRLQASERAARAELGQQKLVLERAQIQAPFEGVVKVMEPSPGTRVARGAVLVQLYDPNTLRLRAAIPTELSGIAGDGFIEGELSVANSLQTIPISNIAPEAKPGRGSVDALFDLPAGDWLLGGVVEFDLLLPSRPGTLALPFDAQYSGERVYVVDQEGRASSVGCENLGTTVTAGQTLALLSCPDIKDGDRIVVNRIPNLVTGTKLKVVEG